MGTKSHGAPPVNTGNTVTVKVGLNMNICRLCLTEGTVNSRLQPVYYSKDTPDEPLLQKILDLTTIQVLKHPKLCIETSLISILNLSGSIRHGFPLVDLHQLQGQIRRVQSLSSTVYRK